MYFLSPYTQLSWLIPASALDSKPSALSAPAFVSDQGEPMPWSLVVQAEEIWKEWSCVGKVHTMPSSAGGFPVCDFSTLYTLGPLGHWSYPTGTSLLSLGLLLPALGFKVS